MKIKLNMALLLLNLVFFSHCKPKEISISTPEAPANPQIFREIMDSSATAWNEGNLEGHLAIYDSTATFMGANGLIGIPALQENFQKKYFNGAKPVQQLAFEDIQVKPLGTAFALITGKFILSGGGLPEKSGRYSLVFGKTDSGWKVLHDHSS